MKLNNKILALLLIFVAILSVSAVSAADIADDEIAIDESSDAEEVLGSTYEVPADATVSDIETIIGNTSAGDTLSFAEGATYDFGNLSSGVPITHTLILQGNGATIKGYQGFAIQGDEESVAGTQVYNLNFEMTNPVLWNGRALEFKMGSNYLIESCSFKNGNSGIYVQRAAGNVTIKNNSFFADEGATNHSTIKKDFSKQETGAKAINLMGGSGILIADNTFEGDYLDAVSIASGASNVEMYNNTMNNVWYGVFYGGGITNITAKDNTFSYSKAFALGIIKAAGDSDITQNTFYTEAGNSAIYVQEGNTAHGAPSNIETILIYENEFKGAGSTAVSSSSSGGFITPKGEFNVVDNTYDDDVTVFEFTDGVSYTLQTNSFLYEEKRVNIEGDSPEKDNNVIILDNEELIDFITQKLPENINSTITFYTEGNEFKFGNLYQIILMGEDNVALGNQNINITVTSGDVTIDEITAITDDFGIYEMYLFYDIGDYNISVSYAGQSINKTNYLSAENENSISITSVPAIIVGKDITLPTASGYRYEITLKDEDNMLLVNKTVQITVNGVTYNRTTNENGITGQNIKKLNMGEYNITTTYTVGNDTYTNSNVLTVIQANTSIKSTPSTYTYGAEGNRFEAQLLDQIGQPISAENGGNICFHINGVNYYKATDADGKAYLNIKLQPGIYNMYMTFDGTFLYAASNGGSQITVQ